MKRTDWEHMYTRPTRLQDFETTIIRGAILTKRKVSSQVLYIPQNGKWEGWFPAHEFVGFGQRLWLETLKPGWTLQRHFAQYWKTCRGMLKAARALAAVPFRPGAEAERIIDAYQQYIRSYEPLTQFLWLPFAIERLIDPWLRRELARQFGEEGDRMFEVIARASRPSQADQLEMALLEWKARKRSEQALKALAQRFGFLGSYSVSERPWTAAHLRRQVAGEPDPLKKLQQKRREFRVQRRLVKAVLQALRPFPKLRRTTEVAHAYTFLRNDRADVYRQCMVTTQPFYRWFEKRHGLPWGWAADLTVREMIDALRDCSTVPRKELAARRRYGYVVHLTMDRTRVIADPRERERFLKRQIAGWGRPRNVQEVRGQVAYPGNVVGMARLLFHASHARFLKRGEVLIANMTHPDYLVAIKRAGAIVTDEGGIVCHAAIISRELKIPCVVGTKIATKVFKDGDRVEVDAIRGIVKKL